MTSEETTAAQASHEASTTIPCPLCAGARRIEASDVDQAIVDRLEALQGFSDVVRQAAQLIASTVTELGLLSATPTFETAPRRDQ
ncbi:hypothetical protein EC912_103434 [Luteibacter rhizovicinus]|uniref:Uncharacterized protein n=1 Tax=Luteibacter rhizovicinus TaxID=242606 RepID=A0A4R3YR93_9GAMM|nr:hypothetical protein [Luteibacter rhizovicinus]TCV94941.1 hypothetical protein EC912_103434 [Luteibacter rhizovicinus]